ncbi:uncharacterized protein BX664DRAFT_340645 [Halteromyces radiatus]|uniref:uncharacterized protein n=1 Tax=Halteromyces radiatus TaxID=101107 RepID=UPI00221EB78A|nr:uncharacterized protein BX664DRAFT_340645 [Halteromyces radiatus]KAI8081535.1 hypothetical protein BX664DRAFT_340645 [Halteromyces radiatus]
MQPTDEDQEMTQEQVPPYEPNEVSTDLEQVEASMDQKVSVVTDFETIANKVLAQVDEEVIETNCQQWEITDWAGLPERVQGPIFTVGGYRWNVLLFPRGNNQREAVSVYLEFSDAKSGNPDNYACAQFVICISKPSDPTFYSVHSAQHRFHADESDWGFTKFMEFKQLANFTNNSYIENNALRITSIVRVFKDPTGVLWHNFQNYDSKKMTGYVGLKNQGATCYMNSLFQSLYCTNYFRKAVYQIPTENDEPTKSVALALQRVFYNLQFNNSSVGTTELTRSFGWDSLDAFMQHDVQEFNRVLQDNLEAKMKNTPADGAIKKLFLGKMKSYIKCINVDYESSRSEDYYDIQLNVKGCKDLEHSFKDYIAEETLEGDNKYHAEGYGLQDAKKGVIFESFPPVLHLQLKRFEYDIMRDTMVKINDRHEFPLSIDLEPYLDESADKSISHEYALHGVLVHSGDLSGGHYFAFVKPTADGKWLKFDDDRVVPSTIKEVLEENYGGEAAGALNVKNNGRTFKRWTNAYMLVYIRRSMMNEILASVTENDIPQHLAQRLEEEQKVLERRRREKEQQHLFMPVMIVSDKSFENNHGLDFVSFAEDKTMDERFCRRLHVRKDQTYGEFKQDLATELGLPITHFRPWFLVNRQNRTIRPDTPIPDEEMNSTLDDVRQRHLANQINLRLYIETPTIFDPYGQPAFPPLPSKVATKILVFIKLFDPFTQDVCGIGKMYVTKLAKVASIIESLNEMAGFAPDTELVLYEEIKPEMIELMDTDKTFSQSEIQDGDIICIQKGLSEAEIHDLQSRDLCASVPDYMNFLYHKRIVRFYPAESNPDMEFDLVLQTTMTYEQVVAKVAEKLNADPDKIMLHLPGGKDDRKTRRYPNGTLADIEKSNYHMESTLCKLTYEVLDISLTELENNRLIKITWFSPTLSDGTYEEFLLPKQSRISDILHQLEARNAKFKSNQGTRQVRVFEAINHRFHREFGMTDPISTISETGQLYAEEIPDEELLKGEEDVLTTVYHYQRDISRTHSVPFKFLIIKDEPLEQTKKRLQLRTGMNDKDWNKVKVCIVSTYSATPLEDDSYKLSEHQFTFEDALGLDHVDKTGRANRNGTERGLTIRG